MSSRLRILVTGAAGGIGRRVRAHLDDVGYDGSYVVSPRSQMPPDPTVDVVDIMNCEALGAVIARRRPDAIIHLASLTGAACESDPERAVAVNVEAVRSLADVARANGAVRFVFASTSAVYGDQYQSPIDEAGPLVLASQYAQTKRDAELVLAAAVSESTDFSAVALRIFNVYGPGMDGSLANQLVTAAADSAVTLAGLDSFVRDYVHVDDVARALVLAAVAPLPDQWSIVNIGTGVPTSNRALVTALAPVHYIETEPRVSYSCADVSAAQKFIGFTANQSLNRRTVR